MSTDEMLTLEEVATLLKMCDGPAPVRVSTGPAGPRLAPGTDAPAPCVHPLVLAATRQVGEG